jgi:Patatin-like phospholipase
MKPDPNVAAARLLWGELSTRFTTEIYSIGQEETAIESLHGLFALVRTELQSHPEATEFHALALRMLNEALRPSLTRWHGWMVFREERWIFNDQWARKNARNQLIINIKRLIVYRDAFQRMAQGLTWTANDNSDLRPASDPPLPPRKVSLGRDVRAGIGRQVRIHCPRSILPGVIAADRSAINKAEHAEINARRSTPTAPARPDAPLLNAAGLAFSGGGIRSATFSLGVVQVLAAKGIFPGFDYLSTVSGGGYLGTFLSAYLGTGDKTHPEPGDEALEARQRLTEVFATGRDRREPSAARFLRNRSRYLTEGQLTAKVKGIGMVIAGVLFNLLIVLPVPLIFVLLTKWLSGDQLWSKDFSLWGAMSQRWSSLTVSYQTVAILLLLIGVLQMKNTFGPFSRERCKVLARRAAVVPAVGVGIGILYGLMWMTMRVLSAPDESLAQRLLRGNWWGTFTPPEPTSWFPNLHCPFTYLVIPLVGMTLLGALVYPAVKRFSLPRPTSLAPLGGDRWARKVRRIRKVVFADSWRVGGRIFWLWERLFPPTAVLAGLALFCWLTPVGFHLYHFTRIYLSDWSWVQRLQISGEAGTAAVGFGATGLLGLLVKHVNASGNIGKKLSILLIFSGPLLYSFVYFGVGYRMMFTPPALWSPSWVLGSVILITLWAWLFVDVNSYSPHGYYRDQLAKCFLQTRRWPPPTKSGAEPHEPNRASLGPAKHLPLSELGQTKAAPYHLINAAVNLPTSDNRNLRGRNGDFFIFSKHFSGSALTGYFPTLALEREDPHLDLGTAMAISGAAASSHMGWQTSASFRLVMTLANIRLGYWLRNPGRSSGPILSPAGPLCLFREMFAVCMDEKQSFLNLSDGGHIENLAVYELLRRRCKFIVCVDGGCEPGMECADFLRLERYASIDLGIRMHYDLSPLAKRKDGHSNSYGILVKIDYSPPETPQKRASRSPDQAEWGWMLYLKLATLGYGPGAVMDYQRDHPVFPHESTADQIFDEAQFEAYRALGESAAESFFVNHGTSHSPAPLTLQSWFTGLAEALLPDNDEAFGS